MKHIVLSIALPIALLLSGCAAQPTSTPPPSQNAYSTDAGFGLLEAGMRELSKNAKRAKEEYFDKVIEDCEANFGDPEKRYYYARSSTESIFYLVKAAAEEKPTQVLNVACAEAYYLAGYASLDLGRVEDAEAYLFQALEWSPVNPRFRSELAHIKQVQRDWDAALAMFSEAEDNAGTFSPDDVKEAELTRAKRGVGFTLIELGRLDEAEAKFKECLEINANDEKAKHELKYIADLRSQGKE